MFFECAPDDPAEVRDPPVLKANVARLRFYERFGVRPLWNNEYALKVKPDDAAMPYLLCDPLGRKAPLRRTVVRRIVRACLERVYPQLCPPAYVDRVVASFKDDPVALRPPRYTREAPPAAPRQPQDTSRSITLVVNDLHDIHHVRERGYVESPVRIRAILRAIEPTGLFHRIPPREFKESHIRAVHDDAFVDYLKRVCRVVPKGKSVYPYVFPIRNAARPPVDLPVRAGYYCIDTFTPLNENAFLAAKRAVDCSLTAADAVLKGSRLAYALVRPPGHHAERRAFGGFCYFNNNAIAAHYLSAQGRVAILDIDYHHGNGQEVIFAERRDVLTISIHGHPRLAYPYFSGFKDDRGVGEGAGFNVNYPLPEKITTERYRQALQSALGRIRRFNPTFLVVALGYDIGKGDPTGTWTLTARDFERNGEMIGALRLPTLVVQEGGYRTVTLGVNARSFFKGLAVAAFERGIYARLKPAGAGPASAAQKSGVDGIVAGSSASRKPKPEPPVDHDAGPVAPPKNPPAI